MQYQNIMIKSEKFFFIHIPLIKINIVLIFMFL